MEHRLFASYSRHDRELVKRLCALLRVSGSTVFRDEDSIEPGTKWRSALTDALEHADCLVLFWSANSAKSAAVREEYQVALRREIHLVPLLLDHTPLPQPLLQYQWIDLSGFVSVREITRGGGIGIGMGPSVVLGAQVASMILGMLRRRKAEEEPLQTWIELRECTAESAEQLRKQFFALSAPSDA